MTFSGLCNDGNAPPWMTATRCVVSWQTWSDTRLGCGRRVGGQDDGEAFPLGPLLKATRLGPRICSRRRLGAAAVRHGPLHQHVARARLRRQSVSAPRERADVIYFARFAFSPFRERAVFATSRFSAKMGSSIREKEPSSCWAFYDRSTFPERSAFAFCTIRLFVSNPKKIR